MLTRRQSLRAVIASVAAALVPGKWASARMIAHATSADSSMEQGNLTGLWVGDDGGNYYIRHTEDGEIWWLGVALESPTRFSNVARGTIEGNSIQLDWVDVPWGRTGGGGVLTLRVASNGRSLTRLNQTGDFGGANWVRS
jgi:hypothetical protein